MSGHSKWSTIKHKKEITDNKRGQAFTKLVRAITVACRDGGADLESNFKLRLAVEKARQVNMPKVNIDRAIEKGSGVGDHGFMEAVYEGFGPGGTAIIVEVLTDNKNRSVSEIKKVFEKGGGTLGQPGSVAFLFDKKGLMLIAKKEKADEQMLELIDLGADDVEEREEAVEVVTAPNRLAEIKGKIEAKGGSILEADLVYIPKSRVKLEEQVMEKVENFMESLDDMDDVQAIYSNL